MYVGAARVLVVVGAKLVASASAGALRPSGVGAAVVAARAFSASAVKAVLPRQVGSGRASVPAKEVYSVGLWGKSHRFSY